MAIEATRTGSSPIRQCALVLGLVAVLAGCSKEPLGGSCTSDFGCDSRAEKCLRVNGADQPGVCSRRCNGPADCAPTANCGRIAMKHVGGIMGKLSAGGGTEAWCLPQ